MSSRVVLPAATHVPCRSCPSHLARQHCSLFDGRLPIYHDVAQLTRLVTSVTSLSGGCPPSLTRIETRAVESTPETLIHPVQRCDSQRHVQQWYKVCAYPPCSSRAAENIFYKITGNLESPD
ncbi:hypothetical protein TCAP_03273 [Tolypocladium capitatum]|uniref:Uncharacterized protein n=1 Tax=Tolypocladium capitatum TaxID=45235 RepID=A0A2K3QGX0_9HYPO|nr:hypothetical protein TCAP_03273 [Tolypocladium capitatum]